MIDIVLTMMNIYKMIFSMNLSVLLTIMKRQETDETITSHTQPTNFHNFLVPLLKNFRKGVKTCMGDKDFVTSSNF